jgi:long-subunit acyl-CoA synthetase (AMP-forming)
LCLPDIRIQSLSFSSLRFIFTVAYIARLHNFDYIKGWAAQEGFDCGNSNEELIRNEKVLRKIREEVDFYNEKFGNWEKIKKIEFIKL